HVRLLSPNEAFVAGMRVHPARRRSGLALALTDYCLRYAADHGRSIARVIIGWNNAAALGAIARAGFRRVASMTLWERAVAAAARAGVLGLPRCRALLASDAATERALEAAGYARGLEYHVWERRF